MTQDTAPLPDPRLYGPQTWWERRPFWLRYTAYMTAMAVAVAGITLLAVRSGDHDSDQPERDIRGCIVQGGDPVFTQDRWGHAVEFLGCRQ